MKRIINFLFWFWGFQSNNPKKEYVPIKPPESFNTSDSLFNHNKRLTDQETNILVGIAEFCMANDEYENALSCYNILINNSDPCSSYYVNRALIYDNLTEFSKSIEDIRIAIELDPDNAAYYWILGGYFVSNEMVLHGKLTDPSSKQALQNAANNYKISLQKDPTNECGWLDMIEINLLTKRWDDAICTFGACKTYINYLPYKLIRSFLGGLALIINGEEVDSEDMANMNNKSIRITNDIYRGCEIESLITDLEVTELVYSRTCQAKEYYKLFLSHYDGELRRYGNRG